MCFVLSSSEIINCSHFHSAQHTSHACPSHTHTQVLRAVFSNQPVKQAVHPKNDVWALGILAVEAATGRHPFSPGGIGMSTQHDPLAQVRESLSACVYAMSVSVAAILPSTHTLAHLYADTLTSNHYTLTHVELQRLQ